MATPQAPKPTCPVCHRAIPARPDRLTLPCPDCLTNHQRQLRRQQAQALAADPTTRTRRIQALAGQGFSNAVIGRAVGLSGDRVRRILQGS